MRSVLHFLTRRSRSEAHYRKPQQQQPYQPKAPVKIHSRVHDQHEDSGHKPGAHSYKPCHHKANQNKDKQHRSLPYSAGHPYIRCAPRHPHRLGLRQGLPPRLPPVQPQRRPGQPPRVALRRRALSVAAPPCPILHLMQDHAAQRLATAAGRRAASGQRPARTPPASPASHSRPGRLEPAWHQPAGSAPRSPMARR